jgi:hypothetical protein
VTKKIDSGKPSASSAAASDFIAAADAICRRLSRDITDPKGTVLNPKSLARLAPRHAALEYRAVKALSKLMPPPSIRAAWLAVVDERSTLAAELARLGRAAEANDVSEINKLAARKASMYRKLAVLATRTGVGACGKAGQSITKQALPVGPAVPKGKRS